MVTCLFSSMGWGNPASVWDFHDLVATPAGVEHFTEHQELALFTEAQYRDVFVAAGAPAEQLEYDPDGLVGRGLYIARRVGRS